MKNLQKGFMIPLITAIVALLAVGSGYFYYKNGKTKETISYPIACTMDAKQCSDGSYVGRTGPNCEFVCPKVDD